jgi:hypothetical protein
MSPLQLLELMGVRKDLHRQWRCYVYPDQLAPASTHVVILWSSMDMFEILNVLYMLVESESHTAILASAVGRFQPFHFKPFSGSTKLPNVASGQG